MEIAFQSVPDHGLLHLGAVYRRADLHDRFGGNHYCGIASSKKESVVLIFHTQEPSQQFYEDGFDSDGLYWYSGQGQKGDMTWNASNKAVREHMIQGRDLFFFERVQRKGGLWQFSHIMRYFGHKIEDRLDADKKLRKAIIFSLLPIEFLNSEMLSPSVVSKPLSSIRIRIQKIYLRSERVKKHAKKRARGVCEACLVVAPFCKSNGEPFLEVHHINRLSDQGADQIDEVAAICPNCHRRCHHGADGKEFNELLAIRVSGLESKKVT